MAGYGFDGFDYYYVMFPDDACTNTLAWAGRGVLGGAGAWALGLDSRLSTFGVFPNFRYFLLCCIRTPPKGLAKHG